MFIRHIRVITKVHKRVGARGGLVAPPLPLISEAHPYFSNQGLTPRHCWIIQLDILHLHKSVSFILSQIPRDFHVFFLNIQSKAKLQENENQLQQENAKYWTVYLQNLESNKSPNDFRGETFQNAKIKFRLKIG